jgi:hypothetical protein
MGRFTWPILMIVLLASFPSLVKAADPHGSPAALNQDGLREIKRRYLGPALGVDQRTVDRLVEVGSRYQPTRQRLRQEMMTEWRRLQQALKQSPPQEAVIKGLLDNIHQKRMALLELNQRQLDEEMALLTPVQQARYLDFLMKLRKQLVREARRLKGGPGGNGGAAGAVGAKHPSFWSESSPPETPVSNTNPK